MGASSILFGAAAYPYPYAPPIYFYVGCEEDAL